MKNKDTKIIRFFLSIVIVSLAFFYIGKYFYANWQKLDGFNWQFNLPYLCLSIFIGTLTIILNSANWQYILNRVYQADLSVLNGVRIFSLSLLGRYVPGKIWLFAGKVYLSVQMGIPKWIATQGILVEFLFFNAVSIYLFGFLAIFILDVSTTTILVMWFFILFFIVSGPYIFVRFNDRIMRLLKRDTKSNRPYRPFFILQVRYLLAWLLQGIGLFFLIRSVYPVPVSQLPMVIACFAISCTLGILALFAPGGIGVREYFMITFFKPFFPTEVILIVIVLARLWLTVIEIFIAVASQTFYLIRSRKGSRKN